MVLIFLANIHLKGGYEILSTAVLTKAVLLFEYDFKCSLKCASYIHISPIS